MTRAKETSVSNSFFCSSISVPATLHVSTILCIYVKEIKVVVVDVLAWKACHLI